MIRTIYMTYCYLLHMLKRFNCNVLVPSSPQNVLLSPNLLNPTASISISWVTPEGGDAISFYTVTWRQDDVTGGSSLEPHVIGMTSYQIEIRDLLPGATYSVNVTATNLAGMANSEIQEITTREPCFTYLLYVVISLKIQRKKK